MSCILVVEDDAEYRELVRFALERKGYSVQFAYSGRQALLEAKSGRPDLILLDLHMPDINGVEVFRLLRADVAHHAMPVIVMTAMPPRGGVIQSAMTALGVDAYLQKPFGSNELIQYVRRAIAAVAPTKPARCLERGDIRVDLSSRQVWVRGKCKGTVGPKRFALLCALMRRTQGAARETLLREVWGESEDLKNVDMTVHRLRKDINPTDAELIVSMPGGYRIVD